MKAVRRTVKRQEGERVSKVLTNITGHITAVAKAVNTVAARIF
jgi:hypothetical protein